MWVGVFGAALFGFTLAWNEFERTYLVTGPIATLPTQLYTVMTATVFQPYIFALGVLTTLFSFVLIALFLIVSGIAVRHARAKGVEADDAEEFRMSAAQRARHRDERGLSLAPRARRARRARAATSAYLWPMSKSAERCGVRARSETASTGTTMR